MNKRGIKRRIRKVAAIMIGVMLGWYFAELAFNQLPQMTQSAHAVDSAPKLALNEEPAKDQAKEPAKKEADPAKAKDQQPKDAAKSKDTHNHHAPESVQNLVPGKGQTDWYGRVVWYAVLLFILAVVLGPVVIALKGPDLPDPADKHDDHAHGGGHGHDAHGGGHGH